MAQQSNGFEGSSVAQMFGYVDRNDRAQWEQSRADRAEKVGFFRSMIKGGSEAMMEFGDQVMRAKLHAAHKVDAQAAFDETHQRRTSTEQRSITESVEFEPEDQREQLGPELDF